MSVLRRRVCLMTFRLSAEEHELLKSVCAATGARSKSDFAREAVLERIHRIMASGGSATLSGDLATLGSQLTLLDKSLSELHGQIRRVLGADKPKADQG